MRGTLWLLSGFLLSAALLATPTNAASGDIVFVTQPPLPRDFATVNSVFGNHTASMEVAPRGGDLYIRYADGTLKNLTKLAGFGEEGLQGTRAIGVRDPVVHWDGTKVLFSMVVGAPSKQYEVASYRWQLYEIAGLSKNEVPVISKVAQQPADFNNVMPAYGSDDAIIFASDRPRDGQAHLYPQLDEYESTPTNTGLWKLTPQSGLLVLLDHAPSGDFHPIVDSFGRIVFSRWDHLQRDQQKDGGSFGTFNYSSEGVGSVPTGSQAEAFPEVRSEKDPDKKSFEELHTINQFFPWMMFQDGTELETLNHVGRHELGEYGGASRNDDPTLTYISSGGVRTAADLFLHLHEDPAIPGRFYGIKALEFGTHASGQVVSIEGAPSVNPADMEVAYVTHPDTDGPTDSPSPHHSGLYRTPIKLSSGELVASHTASTREDRNEGTAAAPASRHSYRLVKLSKSGGYLTAGPPLTTGIKETISYWQPDYLIKYNDQVMWELQPVELVSRRRPSLPSLPLPQVEQNLLQSVGVDLSSLRSFLQERNLALIVTRDVTARDAADRQQPFNLRVANTEKVKVGASGKVYDVQSMQIFQGDLLRGIGGADSPRAGRRVLAQPMHDVGVSNGDTTGLPPGAVKIGSDGSVAAFVPANRALSWQIVAPDGGAVVRERYWVTFQPGEVRVCTGCHGANHFDQAGQPAPTNEPEALRALLQGLTFAPPSGTPPNSSPPAGDDGSEFSLAVVKRGKVIKKLRRGDSFAVRVSAKNSAAKGKSIVVSVVDGKCTATQTVVTPNTGASTISGTVPHGKRSGRLVVKALYGVGITTKLSVQLVAGGRTARNGVNACKGLIK